MNLLDQAIALKNKGARVVVTKTDGVKITGTLFFAGHNVMMNRDQITVDRLPIAMREVRDIREQSVRSIFD